MRRLSLNPPAWLLLASLALWTPACGGSGSGSTTVTPPAGTYFVLTGVPNSATVFNTSTICFRYPNNLTSGIWHTNSSKIIVGEFTQTGFWSHPDNAGGHPATPDNSVGVSRFGRMVHMPLTETVAYTVSPAANGMGPAASTDLRLATINRFTGVLGAGAVAVFSDAYTGSCNLLSSSIDELLIVENATTIRRYRTSTGSAVLTLLGTVTLSAALPAIALCAGSCFGGTFAWDGAFYYFSVTQASSTNLSYTVYQPDGTLVGTNVATGGGNFNGLYFDWSEGRYAMHDGFGLRTAGTVFTSVAGGADSDSQCYSDVSTAHTFHP